ncbi:hypothetical protein BDV29DRAFT_154876 [Aspergillus leporis]|jgi:hypothetical protein|uniref:Uncharacterized protein n=1 Tax=Aspergillus leporis TaxID=41062 RepID=A0A5N5X860_9EURO|nr:hypothetical protein BDV29DRAFT_154876 [Aspergillus leporis]
MINLCFDSCPGLIPIVLLANAPKASCPQAYFLYNNALTKMLLAAEYDGYASERKPLRVSWPQGRHRSTYYLSLPYRYNILLLATSAVLHWIVSQNLFFVEILPYGIYGNAALKYRLIGCGHSPVAIIFGIALGSAMIIAILCLALKHFISHIPLAISYSAAISAACHLLSDDEPAFQPVMWGVLQIPLD